MMKKHMIILPVLQVSAFSLSRSQSKCVERCNSLPFKIAIETRRKACIEGCRPIHDTPINTNPTPTAASRDATCVEECNAKGGSRRFKSACIRRCPESYELDSNEAARPSDADQQDEERAAVQNEASSTVEFDPETYLSRESQDHNTNSTIESDANLTRQETTNEITTDISPENDVVQKEAQNETQANEPEARLINVNDDSSETVNTGVDSDQSLGSDSSPVVASNETTSNQTQLSLDSGSNSTAPANSNESKEEELQIDEADAHLVKNSTNQMNDTVSESGSNSSYSQAEPDIMENVSNTPVAIEASEEVIFISADSSQEAQHNETDTIVGTAEDSPPINTTASESLDVPSAAPGAIIDSPVGLSSSQNETLVGAASPEGPSVTLAQNQECLSGVTRASCNMS